MNDTTVFNEKINECLTVDPTKLTHQQKSDKYTSTWNMNHHSEIKAHTHVEVIHVK